MRVYTKVLLGAGLLVAGMAATEAQASYILTFTEQGSSVVASGKGSVNIADLSPIANVNVQPFINPAFATFALGYGAASYFYGATGTDPFGTGGPSTPDTSSGGPLGYASLYGSVILPQGYTSGAELDVAATWTDATFQSLGLTEGKYIYTWGSGVNADSLTVDVGGISTVPLPASAPLFGAALLAFGVAGYGMRRRGAATA